MARPNPGDLVRNWRDSDLPVTRKAWLTLRNNLVKARTRSTCCGHPGEPGC